MHISHEAKFKFKILNSTQTQTYTWYLIPPVLYFVHQQQIRMFCPTFYFLWSSYENILKELQIIINGNLAYQAGYTIQLFLKNDYMTATLVLCFKYKIG